MDPADKAWVEWKVSRRLAHLRAGLHDVVKHYLGSTLAVLLGLRLESPEVFFFSSPIIFGQPFTTYCGCKTVAWNIK